jgi:hypothetical protein
MPEAFISLSVEERITLTLKARESGTPLTERWRQLDLAVSREWSERCRQAAKWLTDANAVADLGCGQMLLESYLRRGQTYVPVDFLPRDTRTTIVDFNAQPLPELGASHFAALGLLEYIYDLDGFLGALRRNFRSGVASFFVRWSTVPEERRLGHGWVNHHTRDEIVATFVRAGFKVSRRFQYRPAHFLFRLD